jgi:hypothetical protein
MAATCARFIAIQRQNTPQAHSNSPRDPSNARQKSIHFQALTPGVLAQQTMYVSPATNMSASGNQGGTFTPGSFTYAISTNSGTINWSLSGVPAWLTPSVSSGSAGTTATNVTFTVNAASLTSNTYNATITFTNTTNGQGNTTRMAVLTIAVSNQPVLQLTPATDIATVGNPGGPFTPTSWTYTIAASQGTVNFTVTGIPSWLECSPRSGSVGTGGTSIGFLVNSNPNSLAPGNYTTVINFTNSDTGLGTTTRNAQVTVNAAAPALIITPPTNLVTNGDQGGPFVPNSFSYLIKTQTGTINWSISGVPAWLTPSATFGSATTTGTTVTFTVNANSLTPNTYTGAITFFNTDTGSGNTVRTFTNIVTPVATPGVLPGTPLGHWQMGSYSASPNPVVPNMVGAGSPTTNLFRMSRRNFTGSGVGIPWGGGGTITDSAATGWDGTNEASTAVLTSTAGTPWQIQYGDNSPFPAGPFTIAINAESNSGSNETFRFATPSGICTTITATNTWQRFSMSGTASAGATLTGFTLCADYVTSIYADPKNANLQIMDPTFILMPLILGRLLPMLICISGI